MNHETVEPHKRVSFQMLYESCFNHALNTKRSSCEQAGGAHASIAIAKIKQHGKRLLQYWQICMPRRETAEGEKSSFFWFLTFSWKGAHAGQGVKGRRWRGEKRVTKSDEVFDLLLLDNYMKKWIAVLTEEEKARANAVAYNHNVNNTAAGQLGTERQQAEEEDKDKYPRKVYRK